MEDARAMAVLTAEEIGAHPWDVAVASTGAIGHYLPMEKMIKGIAEAASNLSKSGHSLAARAIMTTDTRPKEAAIDYGDFRIGGMAKGAGMIRPNMATMLAIVTTDAEVEPGELGLALRAAVEATFNLITVDGGTSTNDMVLAMASGATGKKLNAQEMEGPLYSICSMLARSLVEDGEGATRFITVRVHEAVDEREAKRAAMAVAESPLVKTAAFGGDPNWGRVIYALGSAFEELDPEGVRVMIGGLKVAEAEAPAEVDEKELHQAVEGEEIEFDIYLGRGQAAVEVWTCDLSYDYVKINAEYHT
jgi:glutamate N-acetyltransferase/amino-acid N-acetyltransferase